MKNLKIKKAIAVCLTALCVSISFLNTSVLGALPPESETVSPMYTTITFLENKLNVVDGSLECHASTSVKSGYTAKTVVELQAYRSNTWTTIKTWTKTNAYTASVNETYTPSTDKYRLKVTHSALNANGTVVEYDITCSDTVNYVKP